MVHFGVELHGIEIARHIAGDRERRVGRGPVDFETGRDGADVIAVAHPDLLFLGEEPAFQQLKTGRGRGHIGASEFSGAVTAFNLAAQAMHHDLLAVADAKDRYAKLEHRLRWHGRTFGEDRGRPPRQDHRLGRKILEKGIIHRVERVDFAEHIKFTQTAGDQLGDLAAEVDDEKAVMGDICHAD